MLLSKEKKIGLHTKKIDKSTKLIILAFVPETIARIHSYWKHYLEFGNKFGFMWIVKKVLTGPAFNTFATSYNLASVLIIQCCLSISKGPMAKN